MVWFRHSENFVFFVSVSDDSYKSFTRQYLHDIVRKSSEKYFDDKLKALEDQMLTLTNCPSTKLIEFRQVLKNFKTVYKRQWQSSKGTDKRFQEKYSEWLSHTIELPCASTPIAASSKGRPSKDFGECSDRTKRRKTMQLRKRVSLEELNFAAEMSNRAAGNLDAAKIINEIQKSPTRASKFRKAAQRTAITKVHSPEEALKIFVDANLTTAQYQIIQGANKEIYPCYTLVQKAKREIYPKKTVSETEAEIKLQDLVDNTATRLCKYLDDVLESCSEMEKSKLTLSYKWGCDGSQQAQYKQKFQNDGDSDANVFISFLVPLRLASGAKVVWQNPTPSSPRFCRPIRIRYTKENNDVTNEEIDYIEEQTRELQPTCVGNAIQIMHVLFPTMVDGKVCNAATHTTSTLRCYICGKTQKSFNDLTSSEIENPDTFKFGISLLHARIRFFEFLLHLSYKIKANVQKGRLSHTDKPAIQSAKENIQKSFKEKTGLLVDFPKAGFGNTNDGNTSRRFFSHTEIAAEITGISKELIERFRIILEVLSSGFEIDTEKFGTYTFETAKFYVDLYPWQPMSPTVHKILLHSPSVIKHALLPIGQLSEEASEARNKHFRQYRENYSRKFSRTDCLEDITNRLLLTSDPYISSIRSAGYRAQIKKTVSEDAIMFLMPSAASAENDDEE